MNIRMKVIVVGLMSTMLTYPLSGGVFQICEHHVTHDISTPCNVSAFCSESYCKRDERDDYNCPFNIYFDCEIESTVDNNARRHEYKCTYQASGVCVCPEWDEAEPTNTWTVTVTEETCTTRAH